jgi:DNA-binding FadR family transcriptional regulator
MPYIKCHTLNNWGGGGKVFKKVKENRIYENIVDQVYQAILRGDLKPKDKLPSENDLCTLFGVSRGTVREAIRYLEQLGTLEVRQGSTGGAYVKEVNLEDIALQMCNALRMANVTFLHMAEARASLERMILREMIPSQKVKNLIQVLEKNIEKASKCYKNKDDRGRLHANFEFHGLIAETTDNPIIILMHKIIVELSQGFFENVKPSTSIGENTLEHHRQIVELLKKGDIQAAADLCAEHIRKVSARIVDKSNLQSSLFRRT